MNNAAVNMGVQVFVWLYIFISHEYLGVELLGPTVTVVSPTATRLFPSAAAPCYVPTSSG